MLHYAIIFSYQIVQNPPLTLSVLQEIICVGKCMLTDLRIYLRMHISICKKQSQISLSENIYNFILSLLIFLWFNYFAFFCRQYFFFLFFWYIMTIILTVHRPALFSCLLCDPACAFNVELDLIPKRSNFSWLRKTRNWRLQHVLGYKTF